MTETAIDPVKTRTMQGRPSVNTSTDCFRSGAWPENGRLVST